jgi:hypothetical protein
MKVKTYIRVARNGTRQPIVAANVKPSHKPLSSTTGKPLPTVAFAVEMDVPDAMFKRAEQVLATLTVSESIAAIAAEVSEAGA